MIALQRHRQILNLVSDEGAVRVGDLARTMQVTEETIRRDLKALSSQGMLTRTHGGAVTVDSSDSGIELPYDERHQAHRPQKMAIARAALQHIEPHQVIALDASTTACQLARIIPDQPLTVVTNSTAICATLASRRRIEVICTGGTLDPQAMAFTGLHAKRTIAGINIQTLFFSCRGIDVDRGLSEASDRHAEIKLGMIESAQQCVLMADSSKLGLASTVFFGPARLSDQLIVDRTNDPNICDQLRLIAASGIDIQEVELAT